MKICDIDMGTASLWSGEEYECEKTGIKLTKFTPKYGEKNGLYTHYKVFDNTRDYAIPEQVFNIIKNLMV